MKNLFTRTYTFPGSHWLDAKIAGFSKTAKLIFYVLCGIFFISAATLLLKVSNSFLVTIPQRGGSLTEGVVGIPHFINPLFAVTDGDKDMVALVYSGLMRRLPNGELIPDLADHYSVSADGKTYDFILKKNITFQDGTPLTADDIVFTIQAAQNPLIKSTEYDTWQGVTVKEVNAGEVMFTLSAPYAPFIENTTLGILPKHLFGKQELENTDIQSATAYPIGSGPYMIASLSRDAQGEINSYTLKPFDHFILGSAYISTLTMKFFNTNQDLLQAYRNGDVDDINSISTSDAFNLKNSGSTVVTAALPRVFGTFFNQASNPALADLAVRQALAMNTNQGYIVDTVFHGFADPLYGPMPSAFIGTSRNIPAPVQASTTGAISILEKDGWVLGANGIRTKKTAQGSIPLAFSISTSDSPELTAVATILQSEWQALGADVTVKVFEGGYLDQNIIQPRKYDALLFGQQINPDLDLFAFWQSSQISDPGLNIAEYANTNADKLLQAMRVTLDPRLREKEYQAFEMQIAKDVPAVFLYSPQFIYIQSPDVKNALFSQVTAPSDRLGAVYTWYTTTDTMWNIFAPHS